MESHPELQSSKAKRIPYRPDLDGLRALAVIPVVLLHFGQGWISGGFIGVDVFFVLSGYLITTILITDISDDNYSISRFYGRRLRRIIPALLAMLSATLIAGWYILLPGDLKTLAKSTLATLAFSSNFFFWLQSDYFDPVSKLAPLKHTWSLAVEEQFYILFPSLLWFLQKSARRTQINILAFIALLSLSFSVAAAYLRPSMGFYFAPTRAWELLIGSLLALGAVPLSTRAIMRDIASIVGTLMIVVGMVTITSSTPFPGWIALVPCLGTGMIIWASLGGGGLGNRILAAAPFVFVGKISYSLYLWHWPIAAYYQYLTGQAPGTEATIVMVAAAMLLAILSWRLIEQPFRDRSGFFEGRSAFWSMGFGAAILAAVSVAVIVRDGVPDRFPPRLQKYFSSEKEVIDKNCFQRTGEDVDRGDYCLIGDMNAQPPTFAVWGDSHASRVAIAASLVGKQEGLKGVYLASGSCPPLPDIDWPPSHCRGFNDAALRQIQRHKIELVIISALWAQYSEGTEFNRKEPARLVSDSKTETPSAADMRRVFSDGLLRSVTALRNAGAKVLIIGPIPEANWDVPRTLTRSKYYGAKIDLVSRERFLQRQAAVIAGINKVASQPGVTVVWPHKTICKEFCRVEMNGLPLYFDGNHLSRFGTSILDADLRRAFERTSSADRSPAHKR